MTSKKINIQARELTRDWINLLRQRIKRPTDLQSLSFLDTLKKQGQIVFKHEEPELLEKAMNIIPVQKIYEEAENCLEEMGGNLEDLVIQCLMKWFKNDFFTWVNNAPCEFCSSTQTKPIGRAKPTNDDLRYGASVIEVYHCLSCNQLTRFPRYGDPGKLLETRRGRCGEWANCFTLCCRAMGTEARIVYDTLDHVWTEVYSEYEQRWIHCDSCEEAWDKPLVYNKGWNKPLSYCIAYSIDEVVDVTKRYTRNWSEVLKRRNIIKEIHLALFVEELTEKQQAHLDQNRKDLLNQRKCKELLELEEDSKKTTVKDEELVGRQSGSLVWRTKRGENGEQSSTENIMSELNDKGYKLFSIPVNNDHFLGNASYHHESQSAFIPSNPVIRLTGSIPGQTGGIYCKQAIQVNNDLKGIEIEFAFRITNDQGGPATDGADGFAFVIQSQGENALGGEGCELGYGGIKKSLAIEFDTYKSYDRCEDPSDNHISIHGRKPPFANSSHHKYSLGYTSRIPSLQSGQWIKSKIRLLSSGIIEVGLGEKQDLGYIQILKANVNFLEYISSKAWVGFTASTGGLTENHDIQWISITEIR